MSNRQLAKIILCEGELGFGNSPAAVKHYIRRMSELARAEEAYNQISREMGLIPFPLPPVMIAEIEKLYFEMMALCESEKCDPAQLEMLLSQGGRALLCDR